jgi:hypothetical protein
MTRSAYVVAAKETVVFWSRKSGNTSLANWLYHDTESLPGSPKRGRKRMKKDDLILEPDEALKLIREKGYHHFVLTRNPYRRAVSAYTAQFISHLEVRDELENLSRFAKKAFIEIMGDKGQSTNDDDYPGKLPGITFIEFLTFLKKKIEAKESKGEPALNAHFNTQVPFAYDGQLDYTHIMRLENIRDDIAPLAKHLGITEPFPWENKNAERPETGKPGEFARTPSSEFSRQGIIPTRASLLNDEAISLIRQAYEIDFRKLQYDPANV